VVYDQSQIIYHAILKEHKTIKCKSGFIKFTVTVNLTKTLD